jgi:hypothetical protein
MTKLWTRDGRVWNVLGDPEDIWKRVIQIPTNGSTTHWVELTTLDGYVVRIRKDHVTTVADVGAA